MRKFKYATVRRMLGGGFNVTISDAENLIDHNTAVYVDECGNINQWPEDIYNLTVLHYDGFSSLEDVCDFCEARDYTIA